MRKIAQDSERHRPFLILYIIYYGSSFNRVCLCENRVECPTTIGQPYDEFFNDSSWSAALSRKDNQHSLREYLLRITRVFLRRFRGVSKWNVSSVQFRVVCSRKPTPSSSCLSSVFPVSLLNSCNVGLIDNVSFSTFERNNWVCVSCPVITPHVAVQLITPQRCLVNHTPRSCPGNHIQ